MSEARSSGGQLVADDLESLIKDIACAHRIPHEAMRAAMAHAKALAPRIEALARRRIAGEWLYPTEDSLLMAGLCMLAAARERAIWPVWLELLELPDPDLEGWLGEECIQTIAAVTLALVDEDVHALAELVDDRETSGHARAALVYVLTRLVCEGRYGRQDFIDIIDRLAAHTLDDDEFAYWNVQEAIVLGGIAERAELLEQTLQADPAVWHEVDKADARERLKEAAANPRDLTRFDEEGFAAPHEPGDAMRWLTRRDARREPDRPEAAPLSWREREWFAGLLKRAGPKAMTFEGLDGFFHAVVLGPDFMPPSECFARIWGADEPVFEDIGEANKILALLQRHWNSVACCGLEGEGPRPWLEPQPDSEPGQVWSRGFFYGVALCDTSWETLREDSDAACALAAIERLTDMDLDEEERSDLLYDLSHNVAEIDEYWRQLRVERMRAERAPVRVQKVGRNEPCPCGSGKKWKKCCGADVTLH